jgi:WD40 repeat protein
VDPEQVDLHRFRRLVTQARDADDGTAWGMLTEAARLWRGPALADVLSEPLRAVSAQLEEERLAAVEARVEVELRLGRYAALLPELSGLVGQYPLRERLRELLMIALFLCGRRADALRVFRDGHQFMVRELGIEPGSVLRQVHEQILRGDNRFAVLELPRQRSREPAGTWSEVSPYLGLTAFSADHARYFFGRDALTGQLVERLGEDGGTLLVVGASGAGKSSLVRAGLVPRLSRMDLAVEGRWHWLLCTPDADPVRQLAQLLASPLRTRPDELPGVLADPARLAELVAVARGAPGAPGRVVVIVDQFEELFTLCQDERQRATYVGALAALTGAGGWLLAVLCVRADFYGHVAAFPELTPAVERPFLVGAMTRAELREVIEGPAGVARLAIEDGLTDLLLHDLGGESGQGSLPLLSYTLLAMWRQRDGDRLTLAGYHATGGIRGAIAKTADETYQRFDPESQRILRRLLVRLVRVDPDNQHTRRRAALADLITGVDDHDPAVTRHVLDQLTTARLVTIDGDAVEITHEALIRAWPRLGGWIDADRASLLIRQQLGADTVAWEQHGRDPAFLYTDTRLADGRALAREHRLGVREQEFLTASERRERRADRRRRTVIAVLVVISVLAVAAGGVALWQRQIAQRQRNEAVSRAAATQIITVLNTDPGLAARLALASYRVAPTLEARSALLSSSALPRVTQLPGHRGPITALATVAGRPIAATAGDDGTTRLWDLTRHRQLATLRGHKGGVNAVAFGAGGRTLFTAGDDGTVRGWDVAKAAPVGEPLRVAGRVRGLVAVGDLLVAGSTSGTVTVWDVSARPALRGELPAHDGGVTAVAVDRDGTAVATAGQDGTVRLWAVAAGQLAPVGQPLTGHQGAVTSLAFSPDGKIVASGGVDHTARLWTAAGPVGLPLEHRSGVQAVAFGADGQTLFTGSDDHVVNLFDLARGQVRLTFPQPETVHAIDVTADGRFLLTGSDNGMLRVWGLTGPILPGAVPATAVAFSPDGRVLATTGVADGAIQFWDSRDPHKLLPLGPPVAAHAGAVTAMAFSPDGRVLATGGADTTIRLWDVTNPVQPRPLGTPLRAHRDPVTTLSFDADGALLASGSTDTVALWQVHDPTTATLADKLPQTRGPVAFHPGTDVLAATDDKRALRLWDVHDPGAPARLGEVPTKHEAAITGLAFDRGGRMLATASDDKTVRLWDATDPRHPGALGAPLTGHTGTVPAVRFGPTNTTLLSAGQDGSLFVWDLHDPTHPKQSAALFASSALTGLTALAVAPDGHTVATGTANSTVVGDIDPDHVADLICATDPTPITSRQWTHYLPDTPERAICP